eukprot:CAMPEP_0116873148 /NCGR_PEP_ID=MMETSP0463-20121206/4147_1 /TAXON_ID=181622 /ORGANISM="Strombidinopsis sp, Strain SopsisLIS2011" /LENGTH=90 /DNA_ID=CAMNT_0004514577 /DNA_START=338 /DNA_END=610 /DNA_ORIENTATION=+
MALVSGKVSIKTLTLENGTCQKHMVTVFTPGKMEIDMKASGTIVSNTAKEQTCFPMETCTQEIIIMENLMARVTILGAMGLRIKGSFKTG